MTVTQQFANWIVEQSYESFRNASVSQDQILRDVFNGSSYAAGYTEDILHTSFGWMAWLVRETVLVRTLVLMTLLLVLWWIYSRYVRMMWTLVINDPKDVFILNRYILHMLRQDKTWWTNRLEIQPKQVLQLAGNSTSYLYLLYSGSGKMVSTVDLRVPIVKWSISVRTYRVTDTGTRITESTTDDCDNIAYGITFRYYPYVNKMLSHLETAMSYIRTWFYTQYVDKDTLPMLLQEYDKCSAKLLVSQVLDRITHDPGSTISVVSRSDKQANDLKPSGRIVNENNVAAICRVSDHHCLIYNNRVYAQSDEALLRAETHLKSFFQAPQCLKCITFDPLGYNSRSRPVEYLARTENGIVVDQFCDFIFSRTAREVYHKCRANYGIFQTNLVLLGPRGVGKTIFAIKLAAELGIRIEAVNPSAARTKQELFDMLHPDHPSVLLLDDIDRHIQIMTENGEVRRKLRDKFFYGTDGQPTREAGADQWNQEAFDKESNSKYRVCSTHSGWNISEMESQLTELSFKPSVNDLEQALSCINQSPHSLVIATTNRSMLRKALGSDVDVTVGGRLTPKRFSLGDRCMLNQAIERFFSKRLQDDLYAHVDEVWGKEEDVTFSPAELVEKLQELQNQYVKENHDALAQEMLGIKNPVLPAGDPQAYRTRLSSLKYLSKIDDESFAKLFQNALADCLFSSVQAYQSTRSLYH